MVHALIRDTDVTIQFQFHPFLDFQCVVYILTLSLEECGSDRSNGGPVVLPLVVPIHGGSDRGSGAPHVLS